MVILGSDVANDLERRLHGLAARDGTVGIPTAGEIAAAVDTAGRSRRAARLMGWAASALARIGATTEALLMQRRAEATSRGDSAPPAAGTRPATPEELEAAGI